jgi:hypothetical protein
VLDVVPANSCSGHAFPDRYTRWQKGVEGSASHQRIISYQFAGLELLVRFEADGYLEEELRQEEGVDQGATKEREDDTAKERGDDTAEKTIPEIDNIHIRAAGQLIPQHAIFELKTRSVNKKSSDQISDHLPRMWTAQIPFCILAFHESGLFKSEDITIQDVREKVAAWQEDNQKLLHQFSVLLKKLVSLARDPEIGKYEVCLQQPGILEIRKQGGKVSSPLPGPLTRIWADQDGSDSASSFNGVSVGAEGSDADVAAHSGAEDDHFPEDFTACSDACEYCGRCLYKRR